MPTSQLTRTRPKLARLFVCGLLLWLAAAAAQAQVGCNVNAAPLNFGVYDTLATADTRVNGGITLTCRLLDPNAANRISYSVSLGPGSGSYAQRALRAAGSTSQLRYNVHLQSVSPGTVWGDGTSGTITASGSVTVNKNTPNKPLDLPMIGVVPALQTVAPGVYSDTLTVTVTWN